MQKTSSPEELIAFAEQHDPQPREDASLSTGPDPSESLEEQKNRCELAQLNQRNKEASDTHTLRINYANKIFVLTCIWLSLMIFSVALAGFGSFGFYLSDKVLMTFIGSTTLSVFGLFTIAARWLFRQSGN